MTVTEALSRPDAHEWLQAMKEEIQSFDENDTWELVNPPEGSTVVK